MMTGKQKKKKEKRKKKETTISELETESAKHGEEKRIY
jgi:hypothetical protein